jgi:hypothetical protein
MIMGPRIDAFHRSGKQAPHALDQCRPIIDQDGSVPPATLDLCRTLSANVSRRFSGRRSSTNHSLRSTRSPANRIRAEVDRCR